MKRLLIATGLFAALACSGLQGQTIMNANIPFDFQLGKSAMPAGDYQISYSPHLLMLRSTDGQHTVNILTLPASRSKKAETGLLQFNRYGNSYFFAGVWTANSAEGSTVPKTSREKELARRAASSEATTIALGR